MTMRGGFRPPDDMADLHLSKVACAGMGGRERDERKARMEECNASREWGMVDREGGKEGKDGRVQCK